VATNLATQVVALALVKVSINTNARATQSAALTLTKTTGQTSARTTQAAALALAKTNGQTSARTTQAVALALVTLPPPPPEPPAGGPHLEELNTTGFLITEIAGQWSIVGAEFGDGFSVAKLNGLAEGLRRWTIKIEALPAEGRIRDDTTRGYWLTEGGGYVLAETGARVLLDQLSGRSQYLWRFFRASKIAGNKVFWLEVEDPETGTRKKYLAEFDDHRLSYAVLAARVYGTGLTMNERRLPGVTSPIAA